MHNDHSTLTEVKEIPSGSRFVVRGQPFTLDLLDTIYALGDVADRIRQEGGSQRAYLSEVIALLQEITGVTLTYGEADWLNDELELQYAAAKKKRRDSIAAALTSPSSSDSTPAD